MKARLLIFFIGITLLVGVAKGCVSGHDASSNFGTGHWQPNPAADSTYTGAEQTGGVLFVTVTNQQSARISGAVITILSNNSAIQSSITGTDGTFQTQLATGVYEIRVTKSGYAEYFGRVTIISATKTIFNVELSPKYSFTGVVKLNTSGEPLPNIFVEILKDGVLLSSTVTTAEGKFIFQDLSAGQYQILLASGSATYNPVSYVIQISKDGTISPANSEFYLSLNLGSSRPRFTVSGQVRDAYSKAPLEYVLCNVQGFGSVLTDNNGIFSFSNLFEGQYQISFSKEGFNKMTASFYLSSTGTTNPTPLNFEMVYNQEKNLGSIVGRYVDEASRNGVAELIVRVYNYEKTTKQFTVIETDPVTGSQTYKTVNETRWEFKSASPVPVKSTHSSVDTPGAENSVGTFKITHLTPTESDRKYFVYIGKKDSQVAVTPLTKGVPGLLQATWYVEDVTNPNRVHSWAEVAVSGNTSTFLTNYEKEYR